MQHDIFIDEVTYHKVQKFACTLCEDTIAANTNSQNAHNPIIYYRTVEEQRHNMAFITVLLGPFFW